MFIQLANKKIIKPTKIVKILKDGENYLIHLRKAPPYELLASEYKWFLFTYQFLVEVDKDVVINAFNIVAYDQDSVFLEDSTEIVLTPEKVNLLKNSCLSLDCGKPDHEDHNMVMNLAERILKMEALKPDNDKIDENAYKKL